MMEEIERGAEIILNGGVVLLPTDTVFGLAANVFDDRAVEKIYQIKNRPKEKPLPVLIADYKDLLKLVKTPSRLEGKLIEAFWPGPLTLVLEKQKNLKKNAFSNKDTVAVRMPDSELVRSLIREAGTPLATTSANLSGELAKAELSEIKEEILENVDFVLEDNEKRSNIPSTIVQVINGEIKILREGAITKEELGNVLT
ncbi:threonylcarbamoyl-AMP synthase [Candidatus Saccharibacteria bacterium]|nr:threonylcarbamoyl-AMP synthase [Candidatus Saccharibacteria bacterium]